MDFERKRVASNSSRNGVAIGSVWESRIRGSFKVFNGDNNNQETNSEITQMAENVVVLRSKQSSNQVINGGGKRKTWKSESNSEETPIQITKARSENKKELSALSEIKKTPIHMNKGRPEWNSSRTIKSRSLSRKQSTTSDLNDGIEKAKSSLIGIQEIRSEELDVVCDDDKLSVDTDNNNTQSRQRSGIEEENEEKAIVVVEQMEPISTTIKKQPSSVLNFADEFPSQRSPKSHNKLQTFIDLIMWRDASKSSLVFGIGTFSILSSSYTQDLNISFISVISYLGLIYLAAIFIFRSFIFRGVVAKDHITDDENEECVVVGEEEAIWALKLFLPYINEFLLKAKALFSGDPSTTMKLAVLLFILARCGSSITIWKMAKLGFLVGFTLPKICSSYSSQLNAYGTFWVGRFKDAWASCSQKKAVALGVFTLVWNLSSVVARIWAVFMLLAAFKYYQQSTTKDEVVLEEEPVSRRNQSSWQEQRITKTGSAKPKKRS